MKMDEFIERTKQHAEDEDLSRFCDWLISDGDLLAGMAHYWLTHHDTHLRQQAVFGMQGLLIECGMEPRLAQAYRRGYTAGMAVAAGLFRGPIDA